MRRPLPGISRSSCAGTPRVPWWSRASAMKRSGFLERIGVTGQGLVVFLPYVWLILFLVVPFIIVLKISFSDVDLAIPPYKPLWEWDGNNALAIRLTFNNYAFLFTDKLY